MNDKVNGSQEIQLELCLKVSIAVLFSNFLNNTQQWSHYQYQHVANKVDFLFSTSLDKS
jgi:hypothetical protein